MAREEPRLDPSSPAELEFRPPKRPRPRVAESEMPVWLHVAIGVFIALSLHSLITWSIAAMSVRAALKQLDAEIAEFGRQFPQPVIEAPSNRPTPSNQRQPVTRTYKPLEAGERCIDGKRFRRIPNGWAEVPRSPCR